MLSEKKHAGIWTGMSKVNTMLNCQWIILLVLTNRHGVKALRFFFSFSGKLIQKNLSSNPQKTYCN